MPQTPSPHFAFHNRGLSSFCLLFSLQGSDRGNYVPSVRSSLGYFFWTAGTFRLHLTAFRQSHFNPKPNSWWEIISIVSNTVIIMANIINDKKYTLLVVFYSKPPFRFKPIKVKMFKIQIIIISLFCSCNNRAGEGKTGFSAELWCVHRHGSPPACWGAELTI